jgi:hypothetical protein
VQTFALFQRAFRGVLIFDAPIREGGLAERLVLARKVILFKETIFC